LYEFLLSVIVVGLAVLVFRRITVHAPSGSCHLIALISGVQNLFTSHSRGSSSSQIADF